MGAQGSKQSSSTAPVGVTGLTKSKLCNFRRGASKKQRDAGRSVSPLSDGSLNSLASSSCRGLARSISSREPRSSTPQTGRPPERASGADMKTPTRKVSIRRNIATVTQKSTPLRDRCSRTSISPRHPKAECTDQCRLTPNGTDATNIPLKPLSAEPTQVVSTNDATRAPAPPPSATAASCACFHAVPAPPEPPTAPCQQDEQRSPSVSVSASPSPPPSHPPPEPSAAPVTATDTVALDKDSLAALLQEPLRRFTLGFDALTVVLQHTLKKLKMLEKYEKYEDYCKIRREWECNKVETKKYKETIRRLESALCEESDRCNMLSSRDKELSKYNEKLLEEKSHLEHESAAIIAALQRKCHTQVELVHSQYSTEQAKNGSHLIDQEESLLRDFSEKQEEIQKENEITVSQINEVSLQQEESLKSQILLLKEDNERVKKQLSIFIDAESKDSRLQASIARSGELEEEVRSLQSVLELRHQEFQELRKNNGSLTRQAEQLPGALQRVTALEARVEDLEAQLKEKNELERHTAQQQCALVEALQKEVNQKNRLTLLNEELQWKLKQNSEVFSALAAMNGTCNVQVPSTSGASSPAVSRRNTNGSLYSILESSSPTKGEGDTLSRISVSLIKRINSHQAIRSDMDDDVSASPPLSPKIKGIVEKNDSVSWVLDMEESSEELVSRLVRRAGSFRGPTPPLSGQLSNNQTLPSSKRRIKCSHSLSSPSSVFRRSSSKNDNSVTISCVEHGQDQESSEHFNSSRSRSHSVSADSVDSVDMMNWGINLSDSYNKIPETYEVSSQNKKMLLAVKNSANQSFHKIHNQTNMTLSNNLSTEKKFQKHSCENGKQNWNCNMTDFSVDESLSKSSGSSAYTSSDEDARNNIDKNIVVEQSYCSKEQSSHVSNILPFSALNICGVANTSDLSLLAACAAAQPSLMPKDAAGEAMVSEETSEEENDHDELDDKDETVSSSITRSASENEEEEEEEEEEGKRKEKEREYGEEAEGDNGKNHSMKI